MQYLSTRRSSWRVETQGWKNAPRLDVPYPKLLVASAAHDQRIRLAPPVRRAARIARLAARRRIRSPPLRERIPRALVAAVEISVLTRVQADRVAQEWGEQRVRGRARNERVAAVVAKGHVRRAHAARGDEGDGPDARLVPDERAREHARLRAEDVDAAVREADDEPGAVDGEGRRDRRIRVRLAPGGVRVVRRGGLQRRAVHTQEAALGEPVRRCAGSLAICDRAGAVGGR